MSHKCPTFPFILCYSWNCFFLKFYCILFSNILHVFKITPLTLLPTFLWMSILFHKDLNYLHSIDDKKYFLTLFSFSLGKSFSKIPTDNIFYSWTMVVYFWISQITVFCYYYFFSHLKKKKIYTIIMLKENFYLKKSSGGPIPCPLG